MPKCEDEAVSLDQILVGYGFTELVQTASLKKTEDTALVARDAVQITRVITVSEGVCSTGRIMRVRRHIKLHSSLSTQRASVAYYSARQRRLCHNRREETPRSKRGCSA